jgi:hypothetical protein
VKALAWSDDGIDYNFYGKSFVESGFIRSAFSRVWGRQANRESALWDIARAHTVSQNSIHDPV